ncbi:MAG: taurine catabolism dioxygenase TauD [Gammaproteobacteria bacterium]|nr:MAG: taurine catabolism dioxygenase TauD [Gammaproteobacteria bacterium]
MQPLAISQPSPFALENEALYQRWRAWKLENYPARAEDAAVEVQDPRALTLAEADRILSVCRKANMVIYRSHLGALADKSIPRLLGERFGLKSLDSNLLADEDSITSLEVMPEKSGRGYIPYSNRRLLWHTDGYYNPPSARIRAMVLHCVRPAAEGGENALLDPDIAYIRLRDADPAHIRALMAPDAMTIPPNTGEGAERPASVGPVFAIDSTGGNLHMRYTARTRSIQWKDDAATRAAVAALEQLLADDSPTVFRYRLNAGEGLLCNNVLHNRTAFRDADDARRLLYRARYHDRIAGTNLDDIFGA